MEILSSTEIIFWACAIIGSLFFSGKVLISLVFGLGDDSAEFSDSAHASHGTEDAFKLVSFYSIGAFLMMFGWSGLAALKQYTLGDGLSILIGLTVGLITMLLTGVFFKFTRKLTSSGDVFSVEMAIGKTGSVYQKIPASKGKGVIHITINSVIRELEAISESGEEIESFRDVTVVRNIDNKTVSVKPHTK